MQRFGVILLHMYSSSIHMCGLLTIKLEEIVFLGLDKAVEIPCNLYCPPLGNRCSMVVSNLKH